jgi:cell filamentation protein
MAFDPFRDFHEKGYLRNVKATKDPQEIKELEHISFISNLKHAIEYLEKESLINYKTFLEVHRIIFSDIYPWAGKDRFELTPDVGVTKGKEGTPGFTKFANPYEIESAINYGLILASKKDKFKSTVGQVMGNLAFAHPFLDGNGRTLILVHMELCHRAGFSIDWSRTQKDKYLSELSREIYDPRKGTLDAYLGSFISDRLERNHWHGAISSIRGLSGLDEDRMSYEYKKDNEQKEESPGDLIRRNAYKAMKQENGLDSSNKIFKEIGKDPSIDTDMSTPER